MFRPTTMETSAPSRPSSCTLKDAPERNIFTGLLLRIAYPLAIDAVPATLPTVSQVLKSAIGSLTISYGPESKRVMAFEGVPGEDLELIHRFAHRAGCAYNFRGHAPLLLNSDVEALETTDALVDVHIPWALEALVDGRINAPGWEQVRTIKLELVEGQPDLPVNISRANGEKCRVDVDLLSMPSLIDRWAPLLSYWRVNGDDFTTDAPDGVHVVVWDENDAQDDSQIATYQIKVDDVELSGIVPPYIAGQLYVDSYDDTGNTPITDDVTVLYSMREGFAFKDLPAGRIRVFQPTLAYDELKLRGLYWPTMEIDQVREACKRVANATGQAVLGTSSGPADALPLKHARCTPVEFYSAKATQFTLREGFITEPKTEPHVSIPEHLQDTAAASVNVAAKSGEASATAQRARVLEEKVRRLPGLASQVAGAAADGSAPHTATFRAALTSAQGVKGARGVQGFLGKLGL